MLREVLFWRWVHRKWAEEEEEDGCTSQSLTQLFGRYLGEALVGGHCVHLNEAALFDVALSVVVWFVVVEIKCLLQAKRVRRKKKLNQTEAAINHHQRSSFLLIW